MIKKWLAAIAVVFLVTISGCSSLNTNEQEQEYCINQSRYDRLSLWNLLRKDMTAWLDTLIILTDRYGEFYSRSYLVRGSLINIVTAKRTDPILYNEIRAAMSQVLKLEICRYVIDMLDSVIIDVQHLYKEFATNWGNFLEGTDTWEYKPPGWTDYFDWNLLPMASGKQNDILCADFNFRNGGDELGTLDAMNLIKFGVNGFNIQCFIVLLAYLDDDIHDIAITAMVNRTIELRERNFDIYTVYMEALTEPSRAFDYRTKKILEKINRQLMQNT